MPVTDAMIENPPPGDWLLWRRTQNGWGYSPLDQVNRDNVGDLQLVWTRVHSARHSAGPIVGRGRIFSGRSMRRVLGICVATAMVTGCTTDA